MKQSKKSKEKGREQKLQGQRDAFHRAQAPKRRCRDENLDSGIARDVGQILFMGGYMAVGFFLFAWLPFFRGHQSAPEMTMGTAGSIFVNAVGYRLTVLKPAGWRGMTTYSFLVGLGLLTLVLDKSPRVEFLTQLPFFLVTGGGALAVVGLPGRQKFARDSRGETEGDIFYHSTLSHWTSGKRVSYTMEPMFILFCLVLLQVAWLIVFIHTANLPEIEPILAR